MCVCGVDAAEGDDLEVCVNDTTAQDANGWCYVSPAQGVGTNALIAGCQSGHVSRFRFLGDALPHEEEFVLACDNVTEIPEQGAGRRAALGESCLPPDELLGDFMGYSVSDVSVVKGTTECASNVCLVNHFQGRVSCPYGQTDQETLNDPQCFVPGTNLAVTVAVDAQLTQRRAEDAVICSCRCDGPGPGEFCECPGGMECAPLIDEIGLPGSESLAGSYCVPAGTVYDPVRPPVGTDICLRDQLNCGEPHPY
jgi:hypothetical protein